MGLSLPHNTLGCYGASRNNKRTKGRSRRMESSKQLATNYSVSQDNALNSTPYHLTLNEKRLMMLVISRIDPMQMPLPGMEFAAEISVSEWRDRFRSTQNSLYDELYTTCEKLLDRPALRIPNGTDKPSLASWVTYAEPNRERRCITVKIGYDLMLFLQGLKEQFTQYDLDNVQSMTSFQSIRLYELVCQFKNSRYRKREFSLDEFREFLDPKSSYKRFTDLRRYVIEKGVKEINKKTDLTVTWEPVRNGRKTVGLVFQVQRKGPGLTIITQDVEAA
jgi:plasmid replication initiation protein